MPDRTIKSLADEIIADLATKYDLVYVDYRDDFTPEQVAAIVKGDTTALLESTEEWESENRYQGVKYVIDEAVSDVISRWEREDHADYSEVKDEFELSDEQDRVRNEIYERDSGSWVKELANHTSPVLLRIPIEAIDEDHAYSYEQVDAGELLKRLGFQATEHNVSTVQYALDNASPEFGTLMGYWIVGASVSDMYDLPCDDETWVQITNPYLYLGNPFMGDGFITEHELHGVTYVPREDLRTDKDAFGYAVDEIYGGLRASQFEAEIKPYTPLWVAEHEAVAGGSGGHTLFTTETEARQVCQQWASNEHVVVTLYAARLCDENDPALTAYDNERGSYFAALQQPILQRYVKPKVDQ